MTIKTWQAAAGAALATLGLVKAIGFVTPEARAERADIDTIFLRNTNEGAKAFLHEFAHREGVKDPSAAGYDW